MAAEFLWLDLERQVRIIGKCEKITKAESLAYFLKRSRGSQLGAWVSDQSKVISSRKLLGMQIEKIKEKFKTGEVPLPDFWGGYRIVPHKIEFCIQKIMTRGKFQDLPLKSWLSILTHAEKNDMISKKIYNLIWS